MSDYWIASVEAGLEEVGITATPEQVKRLAEGFAITAEQSSCITHRPDPPIVSENERLKKELSAERSKVWCARCRGKGRITLAGPYHSSTSDCLECNGTGKLP